MSIESLKGLDVQTTSGVWKPVPSVQQNSPATREATEMSRPDNVFSLYTVFCNALFRVGFIRFVTIYLHTEPLVEYTFNGGFQWLPLASSSSPHIFRKKKLVDEMRVGRTLGS